MIIRDWALPGFAPEHARGPEPVAFESHRPAAAVASWLGRIGRLVVAAALAATIPAPASGMTRIGITVEANSTKANHQPWDGLGDVLLGPVITGAQGPPDLVACIFALGMPFRCLYGPRGARTSPCHDSHDCDWDSVEIPDGMFGIAVLDLDLAKDDFVDAVIFLESSAQKRDPGVQEIEDSIRAFIAVNAPPSTAAEEARRARPFQRILADSCVQDACTLRQSRILLISED